MSFPSSSVTKIPSYFQRNNGIYRTIMRTNGPVANTIIPAPLLFCKQQQKHGLHTWNYNNWSHYQCTESSNIRLQNHVPHQQSRRDYASDSPSASQNNNNTSSYSINSQPSRKDSRISNNTDDSTSTNTSFHEAFNTVKQKFPPVDFRRKTPDLSKHPKGKVLDTFNAALKSNKHEATTFSKTEFSKFIQDFDALNSYPALWNLIGNLAIFNRTLALHLSEVLRTRDLHEIFFPDVFSLNATYKALMQVGDLQTAFELIRIHLSSKSFPYKRNSLRITPKLYNDLIVLTTTNAVKDLYSGTLQVTKDALENHVRQVIALSDLLAENGTFTGRHHMNIRGLFRMAHTTQSYKLVEEVMQQRVLPLIQTGQMDQPSSSVIFSAYFILLGRNQKSQQLLELTEYFLSPDCAIKLLPRGYFQLARSLRFINQPYLALKILELHPEVMEKEEGAFGLKMSLERRAKRLQEDGDAAAEKE